MTPNPFLRKPPNPKRDKPRRVRDRVILRGKTKTERRLEIFRRSGGFCEAIKPDGKRCYKFISWETMQWSHPQHGPYKDDREGIASCAECHEVGVHNPKSVPRKPGRLMTKTEAMAYWQGEKCFCERPKRKQTTFCANCTAKLSPQSKRDIEETQGRDYLQAVAAAETELLGKGLVA